MELEKKLEQTFEELKIRHEDRESINHILELIRRKDALTYAHMLRVGFLCRDIAKQEYMNEKSLFYAGILHDTGKLLVPNNILTKTDGFDERDMENIRKHVIDGYLILQDIHPFSAEVILRHHLYQERPYPKILPQYDRFVSQTESNLISNYARIVALADVYDVLNNRINDKFGKTKISKEKAKSIILEKNPDQSKLINALYEAGIFCDGRNGTHDKGN